MKLLHFTGRAFKILNEGLVPNSDFCMAMNHEALKPENFEIRPKVDELIAKVQKYTYCVQNPVPDGWNTSGSLRKIILRTMLRERGIPHLRAIGFEVDDRDLLVRDHSLWGAKKDTPISDVARYLDSTIPLTDYKENYAVPEILVPYFIPPERLSIREFDFSFSSLQAFS